MAARFHAAAMDAVKHSPFPDFAIVRITHANRRGHVVVKSVWQWFDPMLPAPFFGEPERGCSNMLWAGSSRITSSLWVGTP